MALLNFGQGGGGLFGGLFPELGGGPGGYERLSPEAEAQMAQEARDAAARTNGMKGPRPGGADPTLWNDPAQETLTAQLLRLNPFVGPQQNPQQGQLGIPAASAPQFQPAFPPGGMDAGISGPGAMPQQQRNPVGQPMSLAPPNPGAQFNPTPVFQDAALPPNAQPTQGFQAPQGGQQPDMGDRLGTAFQNLTHSPTLIGGIGNMVRGLSSGQQTYDRPTLQKTGTDPFTGQDTFAWSNPTTQTLTPATMGQNSSTTAAGGMGGFATALRSGVSGDKLLEIAPPEIKGRLQAMLEGREAPPTQAALRNPQVQALLNAAHAIDPTFDETSWAKRNAFIQQYQKGSNNTLGGQRNTGNTALAHLATVAEKAADLGNVDLGGYLPGVAGMVNSGRQVLSTEQSAKANAFNNAVDRYVAEVGRYYSGSSGGGVSEREEARKRFSAAKTPQELAAAIQVERELFQGKLKQMEEQRDEALGPYAKNYQIMMPHGTAALGSIDKSLGRLGVGGPAAPAASAAPSAGVVKWGRDASGKPVPMQ